ncbi:MAG TPA: fibronectin type III domain-containing protein [Acidimicrobiales bacterium]|nr:fibronectin type III domain-containing protein [Acidimicrobiales bacterium]
MRRLTIIAFLLGSLALGWTVIPKATPSEPPPPDDPAHGLVYSGLRRGAGAGACRGNFEIAGLRDNGHRSICTHGPDPAPPGVDIRQSVQPVSATAPAIQAPAGGVAPQGSVPCDGDGASGYRLQLIYARASNVTDRYNQYAGSFQQWAGAIDSAFSKSAAETGGDRHVRFVHDASCNAVIDRVTLSTSGDDSFSNTLNELRSKGYSRTDRKYLVWADAKVYCGIAQVYYDDSAGQANDSNGSTSVQGELARVDSGCWGQASSAEAHELVHTLGGVQTSAPNATPKNHCRDEYDRLCYPDGSGGSMKYVCPSSHEPLLDCNHDDYFSTAPPSGSYLATHWNIANSRFLLTTGATPAPTTTTPTTSTTTTTRPPATTTTAPTTTVPPTTVPPTTMPPTTQPPSTTTSVPTAPPPSAPVGLYAMQPTQTGAKGVVLFWSPPSAPNGTITGYKVYRGTAPTGLTLLTTTEAGITHTDATATSGQLYYYQLSAVNSAGEGPLSPLARMVAR